MRMRMGSGGWAPSPNCQPPSPAGRLAEGGTQALSAPQHCSLPWDKQRRRAAGGTCKSPLRWRFAITWGGQGLEEMGHRGWMGTRGAALFHGMASPSPGAPCPGAGGGAPKPSTMAGPRWVLRRGWCGEERQEPCGLCWATPGPCFISQGRGGHGDGPALLGHTVAMRVPSMLEMAMVMDLPARLP